MPALRANRPHLVGDVSRVIREAMRCVRGPVALASVTAPGGKWSQAEMSEWNRGESASWRKFSGRLRREMKRRHGHAPPRLLAWVAQRQSRGLDHLHLVFWCLTPDHEERVRQWIALYRELHVQYGFGTVDDPFFKRRSRTTGKLQDMIFRRPGICGAYLGDYLAGGQLERFLAADDRSWRAYWISPELMRRSGWNLERCHWVRQGWHVANGTWRGSKGCFGGLPTRRPSWFFDRDDLAWVMRALDWDGLPGSGLTLALSRAP